MFKRIVVGFDGSESSKKALDYAMHLATQDKAKLHIVTAVEPIPPLAYYPGSMPPTYLPEFIDELFEKTEKMQNQQLAELKEKHPDLDIKGVVLEGRAATVLKNASKDADLIVIGHRGQGGVLSWILGSVAKEVVDGCTVPVLVIKDKDYC